MSADILGSSNRIAQALLSGGEKSPEEPTNKSGDEETKDETEPDAEDCEAKMVQEVLSKVHLISGFTIYSIVKREPQRRRKAG